MNCSTLSKKILGMMCVFATLASCTSSTRDNAERGIWSYSESSDSCEVSEIVKLYHTSRASRGGGTGLGALLKRGEDAILTQMYRDRDKHLLRYIISTPSYSAQPRCHSEFEIELSVDGFREGWKHIYSFFQDTHSRICRKRDFSYRLGMAANKRWTSGIVTSCIDPKTKAFSFDINRIH